MKIETAISSTNFQQQLASLSQHGVIVPTYRILKPEGHQIHRASHTQDEEPIIQMLIKSPKEEYAVNVGNHCLIPTINPLPHHPQGSITLWVGEKDGQRINPWHEKSWANLAHDIEFLEATQEYLTIEVEQNKSPAYMFYGFFEVNPSKLDYVYNQGQQTIARAHFHLTPAFPPMTEKKFQSELNLQNPNLLPEDERNLALFTNLAGKTAIAVYQESLERFFGHEPFIYKTPVYNQDGNIIDSDPKTFYSFNNLQEALNKILLLEGQVKSKWTHFCQHLYQSVEFMQSSSELQNHTKNLVNFFKQSIVPNFVIMIPSANERANLEKPNSDPIWVCPFATANVQNLLRGIIVDRR